MAGFIGESKNPKLTYEIMTNVFSKTEVRGADAAGFWGVNNSGKIFYHKEPIKASELVKHEIWQKLSNHNLDILLVHARAASQGVGEPHINKNNHPFASTDKEIGLVHNGRIPEFEMLKRKFQVLSDCDSEILLRIAESGNTYTEIAKEFSSLPIQVGQRMMGIRDIFSLVHEGHMAVSIGERLTSGRSMWLFRNQHRSLWVIDLRALLGQVFFCSTSDIWQDAIAECSVAISNVQKLIELPVEEVWHFHIDNEQRHPSKVNRYQVCCDKASDQWNDAPIPVQYREPTAEIVTKLNEHDEMAGKKACSMARKRRSRLKA